MLAILTFGECWQICVYAMLAIINSRKLWIMLFWTSGNYIFGIPTMILFPNADKYSLPEWCLSHFPKIKPIIIIPGADDNYKYNSWCRSQLSQLSLRAAKKTILTHKLDAVHIYLMNIYIYIIVIFWCVTHVLIMC